MKYLLKELLFVLLVILSGTGIFSIANILNVTLNVWFVLGFLFLVQSEFRAIVDSLNIVVTTTHIADQD